MLEQDLVAEACKDLGITQLEYTVYTDSNGQPIPWDEFEAWFNNTSY